MFKIIKNKKNFKSNSNHQKNRISNNKKKTNKHLKKSFAYLVYVICFSIISTIIFGYFTIYNHSNSLKNLKSLVTLSPLLVSSFRSTTNTIKKQTQSLEQFDKLFGNSIEAKSVKEKFDLLVKIWFNQYKNEFNLIPPKNYIKWINFTLRNDCPLHPRFYNQVHSDLKPFRSSHNSSIKTISREMIAEASKLSNIVLLFLNNKFIYFNKQDDRLKEYSKLFTDELLSIFENRTILLPLNLLDEPRILLPDDRQFNPHQSLYEINRFYAFTRNSCLKKNFERPIQFHSYFQYTNLTLTKLLPVFSRSRTKCHNDILIPAYYHMRPGLVDKIIWKDKQEIFRWHGTTMPLSEIANSESKKYFGINDKLFKQPRARLIDWSIKNETQNRLPIKLDVSFTKLKGCQPNACEYIKKNYKLTENYNEMDTFKAKYVAIIDSYKRFSSRLLNYLFSKSALFVSTIFEEWYTGLIRPWEHYIPFQIDFSDLEKNLLWAVKNQSEVQKISLKAQIFSHKFLNLKCMQSYVSFLVLEYENLLI